MATALPPIRDDSRQRCWKVCKAAPAVRGDLVLRLSDECLKSLSAIARGAGCKVPAFIAELIEVTVVDRAKHMGESNLFKENDTPPPVTNALRRRSLTGEDEAKILAALEAGLKVDAVAERFSVGSSTIRRVRERVKKRAQLPASVVQKIIFLAAKKYDGGEFLSVPKIAKMVGEPEGTVAAVLAVHRPLVEEAGSVHRHPPTV